VQTRYPVLYLNDGQNIFNVCTAVFGPKEWGVDETANRLIAEGKVEPLIIVAIDNAGRHTQERLPKSLSKGRGPMNICHFPTKVCSRLCGLFTGRITRSFSRAK